MSISIYAKPIAAIATLLDCLYGHKDFSPYFPIADNYIPLMHCIDGLAESCDLLIKSDIGEGTFFLGFNGQGFQGMHLDFLFSSATLKLAASLNCMQVFPLDEAHHEIQNKQMSCFLEALLLILTRYRDDETFILDHGERTRLYAVCHGDSSAFRLLNADGEVVKEGNWLRLLDIFEGNEESEKGLERYWA